jgi:drug/metabolite transporter (DMT)-like permease
MISHVAGQGLITFALAHLPAGFSSVSLLLQPVVAAVLAWAILSEPLTLAQAGGGSIILLGIVVASWNPRLWKQPPLAVKRN